MPTYEITYSSMIRNTVNIEADGYKEAQEKLSQLPIEELIVEDDFREEICVEEISKIES